MNPPINPMPEGVSPKIAVDPSTDIVEYPNTSGSAEVQSYVQTVVFVLEGATAENYAGFDIPNVASSAAAWDDDFEAYVWNLEIVQGVNTWVLTYNGDEVWTVRVNITRL